MTSSSSSSSFYSSMRAAVDEAGGANESRVQVNQRALIDKILARYASAGAVYRELLQNSNDAEADTAEIYFTTAAGAANANASTSKRPAATALPAAASSTTVTQVMYRNNGLPFRHQDWDRLKSIAEGNPSPEKIGAFGVGAYTMFSICEEPLIVSGKHALCFFWKGDALWTRMADAKNNTGSDARWTSFVLPSRDPYQLPNMEEFGEFLCAALTFTKHLKLIRVLVDDHERLCIIKTLVQEPRSIATPKSNSSAMTSWFRRSDAVTASGIFTLASNSIMEFVYRVSVTHTPGGNKEASTASLDARYVSASATTNIKSDMARRMERVTKKQPPSSLAVQLFLNAEETMATTRKHSSVADRITQSFCPQPGKGRIFIGFRTSQTTGLGAHVAAPFVPTVEREAMDLQDATLRTFNTELLEFAGMLMRYTLEDTMFMMIDSAWQRNKSKRQALQIELEQEHAKNGKKSVAASQSTNDNESANKQEGDNGEAESSTSSGLMGFAKFMARGVKKKIVSVVSSVDDYIDDGAEYLKPVDFMPLSEEETQAVILMRSFCPEQSTPDATVGMCIAEGFSKCIPGVPPVLTKSGVVKGDQARLPNKGIESFVEDGVVRRVVYSNAEEYHTVIAAVRKLQLDDLLHSLYSSTLELDKFVFFLKWWIKYAHTDLRGAESYGLVVKDAVKFFTAPLLGTEERRPIRLKDILFYVEKGSVLAKHGLPMPESVIAPGLATVIGASVLTDNSLRSWFSPLPIEVWVSFVAHLRMMSNEDPKDGQCRIDVLSVLSREYSSRSLAEKITFGSFLASLLGTRKCIQFDAATRSEMDGVAMPSDLYTFSAELEAFEAVGTFHKVSAKLQTAGVSEEFLMAIGVRKSVSIDFLFESLDSLRWSNDPKSLVEYLRSATITQKDIRKLQQTRYLPAEAAGNGTFAPSELYLPNSELRMFPFVRILQWPSETDLDQRSENGAFLVKLGMKTLPPLADVMSYAASKALDEDLRSKTLDYIADRLGPHGLYHAQYMRMDLKTKSKYCFLPCITKKAFGDDSDCISERHSPLACYSVIGCVELGFPVLDPGIGDRAKLYASLFQCAPEPDPNVVLERYFDLIDAAQRLQNEAGTDLAKRKAASELIDRRVNIWYHYLSHRSSDFSKSSLDVVRKKAVIPCKVDGIVRWFGAAHVFFRKVDGQTDAITEELFHIVDFNPFLATLGVKQEASTADLFQLVLDDPQAVLDTLGSEEKYRLLLRRVAASPPFARVTPAIRQCPFLLGYTAKKFDDTSGEATYRLYKAEDIYVIDNTFFARMFPVARAPPETDLEDFYSQLGSKYISNAVERRFEVVGRPSKDTDLTKALKERILARGPLLVSPSITSRPLVPRAETFFTEKRLEVYEASKLMAVYALEGVVRRNPTTCFSKPSSTLGVQGNVIYMVQDFDWFDVGYAIGDLILTRCQLEDAFFISSLLEAPIEQLKARGFPVERILKPEPPEPIVVPEPAPVPHLPAAMAVSSTEARPTIAAIPPESAASPQGTTKGFSPDSAPMPASTHDVLPNETGDIASPAPAESFKDVLEQMFPGMDAEYLFNRLGPHPTMEQVQHFAEELSSGNYPKNDNVSENGTATSSSSLAVTETDDASTSSTRKSGLRKKLGRAFNGLRPSNIGGSQHPSSGISRLLKGGAGGGSSMAGPGSTSGTLEESQKPVPAVVDAQSHDNLGRMLQNTISSSTRVNQSGIHSQSRQLTSIPQGLDRGETCEMIPGHSLKPFAGPRGNGCSSNGILIFSARENPESESFLAQNDAVIESFAVVLERLCGVFDLALTSVAMFHDPNGGTIAFNAGKALHCNIRFFYSLFYSKNLSSQRHECYSYWFVTFCHELAHNLVSAHNKEHGFYTESYVSMYLPKLAKLLASIE